MAQKKSVNARIKVININPQQKTMYVKFLSDIVAEGKETLKVKNLTFLLRFKCKRHNIYYGTQYTYEAI